jgi:hypothetical protein
MEENSFYCSELSRAAAEKTYGTASIGAFWILLEYPFAWDYKALEGSNLPPSVKAHLDKIITEVRHARLLFIKKERSRAGRIRLLIVRCRESEPYIIGLELEDYRQLLDIDLASVTKENLPSGGSIMHEQLFLVCTHGRRDKCCAKFGFPLFKSLRGEAAGQSVWQCSHIGGDRFAANLVCFPHGLFYAHVTVEAGKAIMKEYQGRRLALPNYRGRACYAYPVQAAEFFIRTEASISAIDDLRYLNHSRLGQERWQVRFLQAAHGIVHKVTLNRFLSDFQNNVTCHAQEARRVPQFQLDDYEVAER